MKTMTKNKAHLLHCISSLQVGGAEIVFRDLLQELGNTEFEHRVIYFHDGPVVARIRALGIPTYQITGLLCRYDPVFCWRLIKCIWQFWPDCIASHLWAANVLATIIGWFFRISVVCVLHCHYTHLAASDEKKSRRHALRGLLERLITTKAPHLVAVSESVKKEYIAHFGNKLERITVIPNGIDQAYILRQAETHPGILPKNDDHFIIGSVGRFIPRKNYAVLIKAFAQLHMSVPQLRLLIIGFGPEQEALERLIKALDVERAVTLIVGQSAYGYYPFIDLFVQPSLSEGLSIALLEAMSFGICPIVTGRNHPVIKDQSNGMIIEPTKQALVHGIKRLYEDSALRKSYGRQAKETVEESCTIAKMAQSYKALFKQAQR